MSHYTKESKTSKFARLAYCPACGVASLSLDTYRKSLHKEKGYTEYVCTTCGFGFHIGPSLRWEHAITLFAEHRRMRPVADEIDGKGVS